MIPFTFLPPPAYPVLSEVTPMAYPHEKCYPGGSKGLSLVGYALLAAGILLVFCCIPVWAWLALLGILLIAAGFVLLRISQSGR